MPDGPPCAFDTCMSALLSTLGAILVSGLAGLFVAFVIIGPDGPISIEKVSTKPAQLPKCTVVSE